MIKGTSAASSLRRVSDEETVGRVKTDSSIAPTSVKDFLTRKIILCLASPFAVDWLSFTSVLSSSKSPWKDGGHKTDNRVRVETTLHRDLLTRI